MISWCPSGDGEQIHLSQRPPPGPPGPVSGPRAAQFSLTCSKAKPGMLRTGTDRLGRWRTPSLSPHTPPRWVCGDERGVRWRGPTRAIGSRTVGAPAPSAGAAAERGAQAPERCARAQAPRSTPSTSRTGSARNLGRSRRQRRPIHRGGELLRTAGGSASRRAPGRTGHPPRQVQIGFGVQHGAPAWAPPVSAPSSRHRQSRSARSAVPGRHRQSRQPPVRRHPAKRNACSGCPPAWCCRGVRSPGQHPQPVLVGIPLDDPRHPSSSASPARARPPPAQYRPPRGPRPASAPGRQRASRAKSSSTARPPRPERTAHCAPAPSP